MKFVLNTATDPHFCALFDESDQLVERHEWTDRRGDGRETYGFLAKHQVHQLPLSFIGGVSGPGGFSSLRAGGGILNALAFAKQLPVHQVRADEWVRTFLQEKAAACDVFLLNSFSDGVFVIEVGGGQTAPSDLRRVDLAEAVELVGDRSVFVGLLPPEKQARFPNLFDLSFTDSEVTLLRSLQASQPQESFRPEYAFPAV